MLMVTQRRATRTVYQDTGKVRSLLANGKILSFSADGKVIFSQAGPNVRGYDVSTGQETFHVAHRGAIRQIATGPNLNYFATGSADHTVKVVATADGSEIFRLSHTAPVTSVKFSLDGRFLGTGSEDGTALLVDTSKWPRKLVDCQTFNGLVVSRANADILTCQGSNDTKIIRLTTGEQVLSLEPYIAFSINRSSDRIAVQDRSGLRVMSFPGGKELVRIPGKFQRSALSPDGSLLAGSVDETVTIWSVSAGALIFSQKLDYSESLMFLNDKILVVRSQDHGGMVDHFISIASKQEIGFFPYGRLVTETALDNSGRYMAAAAENSIDLLQLNPQIAKTRSCSWFEAVRSLALSPDGTELAVGGAGYIGVFRTEDCRELGRIPQEGNVDGIAFGAGPAILAMESRGDQLEIDSYSLRPPDLLTEACGRLTRNLSATEWRRYFGAARYHKTCSGLPEGSDQLPIPLSKGRTKSTQLEPQP